MYLYRADRKPHVRIHRVLSHPVPGSYTLELSSHGAVQEVGYCFRAPNVPSRRPFSDLQRSISPNFGSALPPLLVSPLPAGVIGGGGGGVEVLSWSVRFPGTKGTYVSVGWSGCKHIAAQVRNIAASW